VHQVPRKKIIKVGLPINEADFTAPNLPSFSALACLIYQMRKMGTLKVIEHEANHSDTHIEEKSDTRNSSAGEGRINLEGLIRRWACHSEGYPGREHIPCGG